MQENAELVDITIDRAAAEMHLTYSDGNGGAIGLSELRRACPCAGCRSARQAGRAAWTPTEARPEPGVNGAELVGAWGLSITWHDGHSTGIYPLDSLAEWLRAGRSPFQPDSGLGA